MERRPKKTALEKEIKRLERLEERYISKRVKRKPSALDQKLEEKIPDTLQNTLNKAFAKAFSLVFEKGTPYIEKSYKREKLEQDHKIRQYTAEIRQDKKSLRDFSRKSRASGTTNILVSGTAGIGMGLLGMGIPDIPLFTAMLLRTVYEIALHYGYTYDTPEEKRFILLIIQAALSCGEDAVEIDRKLNAYIENGAWPDEVYMKDLIAETAECLSGELLYMKFLQGIPIVGAVGGAYDVIYIKQVSEYADLKYRHRFFRQKWGAFSGR